MHTSCVDCPILGQAYMSDALIILRALKLECCSDTLFACSCSTNSACWATIDAPSNGSRDGSQHCNRKVRCLVLAGDRWVEGQRVAEAQWRNLCAPFCNNRFSWLPTNLLPTAKATHCTLHCNRMGTGTWC